MIDNASLKINDLIRYDELLNQYVLTKDALVYFGVDVRSRLSDTSGIAPETQINYVTYKTSNMIYGYIHGFNADNALQDHYISTLDSLRKILFKAMIEQVMDMFKVGVLDDSLDINERAMAISPAAIRELNVTVPELGVCILYRGKLPRCRNGER